MAARRLLCKLGASHRFDYHTLSCPFNPSQTSVSSSAQRPISRSFLDRFFNTSTLFHGFKSTMLVFSRAQLGTEPIIAHSPSTRKSESFHSLLLQGSRKRRPSRNPRKKRAALRPPGPHRWIIYKEGEAIPPSRPNEGSVRRRKHCKRMEQRAAFRSREAQKRKDQLAAVRRRKAIKKIERKMAAVARERAWAERLTQLKQAEADARKATA